MPIRGCRLLWTESRLSVGAALAHRSKCKGRRLFRKAFRSQDIHCNIRKWSDARIRYRV